MTNRAKIEECLTRKMAILEQMMNNTEIESRFILKREMRGLRRLLKERAQLIQELIAVNRELEAASSGGNIGGFTSMIRDAARKEQEVLEHCNRLIREALAEREKIRAELNNLRMKRQLKKKYITQWSVPARGKRFNIKK